MARGAGVRRCAWCARSPDARRALQPRRRARGPRRRPRDIRVRARVAAGQLLAAAQHMEEARQRLAEARGHRGGRRAADEVGAPGRGRARDCAAATSSGRWRSSVALHGIVLADERRAREAPGRRCSSRRRTPASATAAPRSPAAGGRAAPARTTRRRSSSAPRSAAGRLLHAATSARRRCTASGDRAARELGITYEVMLNLHNLGDILVHTGDLPRAYGAIRQSLALCEECGYERLANYNRMFLAFLDGVQGTVDGEKLLRQGIAYAESKRLHLGRHRRAPLARAPAAPRGAAAGGQGGVRADARARARGGPAPRGRTTATPRSGRWPPRRQGRAQGRQAPRIGLIRPGVAPAARPAVGRGCRRRRRSRRARRCRPGGPRRPGGATMASTLGRGRGLCAQLAGEAGQVEALGLGDVRAAERREEHVVGRVEGLRVGLLVDGAARGRAARLERHPQRRPSGWRVRSARSVSSTAVGGARSRRRRARRPARPAAPAGASRPRTTRGARARRSRSTPKPSTHAASVPARCGCCGGPAPAARSGRSDAPPTNRSKAARRPALTCAGAASQVAVTSPVSSRSSAVVHDARLRLSGDDRPRPRVVRVAHDEPALGHARTSSRNAASYDADVRVDVDVIVLDARHDDHVVGADAHVVQELGLLVPVDGVVLVALDHERARGRGPSSRTLRRARSPRPPQALGDAADEPAGLEARLRAAATRTWRSSSSCRACPPRRAARRRARKCSRSAPDIDVRGRPSSSAAMASGLSRRMALPDDHASGAGARWRGV